MSAHTVYSVERDGRVLSFQSWRGVRSRELAQHPNSHGYMRVRLTVNGHRVVRLVHTLVAAHFLGPRPSPSHEVCHINGDRTDNHASNLRWGTRQDNADDRERHGRTSRGTSHAQAVKRGLPAEPHNKGKPTPEAQRRKLSDAMRGKPWSAARRAAHVR